MSEREVIAVQCSMCRTETKPDEWKDHQRACRPKDCYCEELDPDTECSECFEWIPLPVNIVGRFRGYNPSTHRIVPRDAVVLEREHVDTLVDLASQAIQPWWKDEPRLDYKERYREGHDAIEHAESALASAQGNEEGSDG